MRFWTAFLSIAFCFSGFALAAPTSMTLMTDAPARTASGNYFVRGSVDENATYTGLVTLRVTDTYDWVNDGWAGNVNNRSEFSYGVANGGSIANPTNSGMTANEVVFGTGLTHLYWRSSGNTDDNGIVNVVDNLDGTFDFTIRVNGKGTQGDAFIIAVFSETGQFDKTTGTYIISGETYALIDNNAPDQDGLDVTAPAAVANQSNYIGRNLYDVTAAANVNTTLNEFSLDSSGNTEDTVLLEFYSTNVFSVGWESDASTLRLGQSFLTGSSANLNVDFSSANIRQGFIGIIGYDAAGNPTASQVDSGSNLLDTKWLALGQFQDDRVGQWYGDSTYAGNWGSSVNITAGQNVNLRFFATDHYGELDTSYDGTGNVELATAASNAPSNGYDGSVPDVEIGSGNATSFFTSGVGGVLTYSGCVVLYRQEHVQLGNDHGTGSLWSVDSPIIEVRHNLVDDVVFVSSGNMNVATNWQFTSSDNGIAAGNIETTGTPVAGNLFGMQVAIVDEWLNICNTTGFGGLDTITLSANSSDNITSNANIYGYIPYGSSNLDYSVAYPSTNVWNVNGTEGLITLSTTFYVEESGNVTLATTTGSGVENDDTSNNEMRLTVDKANNTSIYFDDTAGYSFTGGLSGNFFTAGGSNTIYAHVTDLYGNHYTTNSDTINISANISGGNLESAYWNDASNYDLAASATNGVATFTNVRFDRSTNAGNVTRSPYDGFGIFANYGGTIHYSETVGVAGNIITNIYFATIGGEPTTSANLLTTSSNMNSSGNAVAGNTLLINAVVADMWGNVDITGANTIILDLTVGNTAPDGSVPTGSNILSARSGNILMDQPLTATFFAKQSDVQITLSSNADSANLVSATSNLFDVIASDVTGLDFVDYRNGTYGSGNVMADILAGANIVVAIGGTDAYKNVNDDFDVTGTGVRAATTGTNITQTSASGNVPQFTWSSNNTGNFGYTTWDVTLFDAEFGVVIEAYNASYSTNSENFNISANTTVYSGNIEFVDSNTFGNDDIYWTNDNVLTNINQIAGNDSSAYAGNTLSFILAELDGYGNLTERSGVNLMLNSHNPSVTGGANFNLTGANTVSANFVGGIGSGNGVLTSNGFATASFIPYYAENSIQILATGGNTTAGNASSLSPSFNVAAGTPALLNFTTNAGAWPASTVDLSDAGQSEALDDIYVGIFDAFGNQADLTRDPVTMGVNLVAYVYETNASATSSISSIGNIQMVSPSTNVTNNVIYFDPNDTDQQLIFSGAGNFSVNVIVDYESTAWGITSQANTDQFRITDTNPVSVTLTSPTGGEEYFAGETLIVTFDVLDTVVEGTYAVYISYDSGVTYEATPIISSTALTEGVGSVSQTDTSYTIPNNINSETVRLRVQVTDGTGNVDEDASTSDFTISPFSSVIAYVVGDISGNTASLKFRESVYSNTGSALQTSNLDVSGFTLSSITHTAGTSTADLAFSTNITSDNVNSSSYLVGLQSGNVSRNPSGAGAFTKVAELAGVEVHQIVSGNVGSKTLKASSNVAALGLKLVSWSGDNISIKEMRVQLDSVTGSVNTADLQAFSTGNLISEAISLVDSNGNPVDLAAVPTLAVGSEMTLSVNQIIPSTPLTGSDNYNYQLYVGSSAAAGNGDVFTLTLNSILFEDYTSGTNIEKLYVPFGTLASDNITIDSLAPAAPTVTYSANINNEASSSSYYQSYDLVITSEAGANIHYLFDDMSGNTVGSNLISSSGSWTTSVNLISLGNTSVNLMVWAIDEAGNNGNTNAFSATLTKDLTNISAGNVAIVFNNGAIGGNINSSTNTSASVNIALLEAGEENASYTVTFTDGTNNVTSTGSFGSGANTIEITGLDLSSLGQGTLSVNLMITDQYGNTSGAANLTNSSEWDVTIDTIAPVMGNLTAVSSDNLISLAEATAGVDLGLDALDGYATINFVLSGNSGNLIRLGSNVLTGAGNFASNNILTDFADGAITLTANATDPNSNRSADLSMTLTLDTSADNTTLVSPIGGSTNIGRPTLVWTQVTDAASYGLYLDGVWQANLIGSTNVSYSFSSNLLDATYTWSVNVIDNAGNESTGSSTTFVVASPSAPTLLSSLTNDAVSQGGDITFSWSESDADNRYYFRLPGSTVSVNQMLSTNTYQYAGNLVAGTYTWSVNVLDEYGNDSTFASGNFVVNNPSSPVLVAPANGSTAIGQSTFGWNEVTDAKTYQFILAADTTGAVSDNLQMFTAGTNSWTYSTNLVADSYTWSLNVLDIYGNSSTFSMNSFSVANPSAPTLDAPVSNARVNVDPRLSWNDVTDARTYSVMINGAVVSGAETVSQYDPATLTEGNYTWSVNVTDIYGNTSVQSTTETFQVVIPDISYVAADHGSTSVVVEFNEDVTSATGSALSTTDFEATDLGGVLTVVHSTTEEANIAKLTFAEAADIDAADDINAAATSIKNTDGNYVASTDMSVLRQIAFEETVTTATPLNYSNGTTETSTLGKFKLRGWGTGTNVLNGFTYTLTATSGVVNATDLANGAEVSLLGPSGETIAGSVSGTLGLSQTFTLTSANALSTTATQEYSVIVSTESNMTTLDMAKAFQLTVASVNLTIGSSANVVYKLAGDETTDELVLTNVDLRDPFVAASNNTFVAADNIFKVPGVTVTFIADYVSDSASYSWTQTSGNAQTINGATSNVMTIVPSEAGQFDFALNYTLGNYTITTPSVNIVVLSPEDANVLEDLISGDLTLSTNSDFQATADLLAQFVGTTITSTEAASLLDAIQEVLNQFEAFVDAGVMTEETFSSSQAEQLVNLVDEATKELSGADLVNSEDEVLGILDDIVLLPTVSEAAMIKAFNAFGTVSSNLTTNVTADEIFTTSANLALAALDSIENEGKKTFTADTSANTKTSVSRIYAGQTNSAAISDSLGSLVTVSVSTAALAEITGAEAIQATLIPSTGSEAFSGDTIGSSIFEVNAISRTGTVTVSNLTNPIEISIRVNTSSALLNYTVAFFNEATGTWDDTGITETARPDANGLVSFKTNHLTKFAVFTSARSVGGGGGGGGCLLK